MIARAPLPRRACPARGQDGFTLIEMLVTLAILGLAVTVLSRSMGGLGAGRRPAQVSAALSAEIGMLRAEALRSGRSGSLVFDPRTGLFLSSRRGAAPIRAAGLAVTVEPALTGRPVPGEIRFLPDGSATGGRIVLRNEAAQTALSVSALTGRVRSGEAP